ncbi:MAG: OadG family protein [Oscillospiraceae bacterium]|nr:OadG family protein [Oscillospiraceae bacterium]
MEVSNAFVVAMGMGVTFVGLTCIIFLTMLMGKIMTALVKPEPPKAAAVPAAPAAPAVPADGLTGEVKVAILAALAQEPGFNLANVTNVSIRKI